MFHRTILLCSIAGALVLSGCSTPYKEKDEADRKIREGEQIKDQAGDTAFQAFLGRLKIAVSRRDRVTLVSMMVPPNAFGYRWYAGPAGESAFDYWDQNNLWGELSAALDQQFIPHNDHMVSLPTPSGYYAGIRQVGGSWKLSYFVPPEPTVTGEPVL